MEVVENRGQWQTSYDRRWLAHYQETGEIDWSLYPRPRNRTAPAGRGVDLSVSRLSLITSSGAYVPGEQVPFDAAHPLGDYSIRLFPSFTPLEELAYAQEHFDHEAVIKDPQVLIPLRHLDELVAEGAIGELAPSVISFMGYQPDVVRVVDEMIPAIVQAARAEAIQAALLVPA
jgi:D-proline reductase (dithiol) PrdB